MDELQSPNNSKLQQLDWSMVAEFIKFPRKINTNYFSSIFWQDSSNQEKGFRYEVAFDNITSKEDEYTVTISTELNGRTVTQTVEKFPMGQPDP